ncbi:unnamed protein product [Caenorhabditis auriculariae]|uniref:G-protein coupled receptors family 1 profile domain-containing protein n=1 Tax=Caenorhabditis auriculariae TaxID=2777116 RepID=A0A8S1HWJ3_9PELO|nr:unnamed protein product [Caenorhabditis auriculariae]
MPKCGCFFPFFIFLLLSLTLDPVALTAVSSPRNISLSPPIKQHQQQHFKERNMLTTTLAPAFNMLQNISTIPTVSPEALEHFNRVKSIYQWLIPIMIVILLVAIIGNGVIVVSCPFLTSPVSPYLQLCISLALADMTAASLLLTGLVVNSYLPVVLGFNIRKDTQCMEALLEMFRISGMLTSDMHLFALAINQFVGTMWPLKYKILVTTRRIRAIYVSLWVIPLVFTFLWFIAYENDGFRNEKCAFTFYNTFFPFRITIFMTFMLPLVATLVIYGLIITNLIKAKEEFETSIHERRMSLARRSNVYSKLKLVRTTLIIVVTFSLSWGLCVLYFLLVCADGCPFKYGVNPDFYLGLFLSSSVNALVMIKLASNPFIYTLRIKAIRASVDQLLNFVCRRRTFPAAKSAKASMALLNGTITVANTDLPRANSFKYLGSTIAEDGSIANDVTARIQSAWMKWRSTTGVMCDRLKSKIYRTVIRPVAMYGTECWPATEKDEAKLAVMETTMLRWTAGVTRLDHVKNEDIRKRFGVAPIREKLRENRLRWFGHVLRADLTSIAKTSHTLETKQPTEQNGDNVPEKRTPRPSGTDAEEEEEEDGHEKLSLSL